MLESFEEYLLDQMDRLCPSGVKRTLSVDSARYHEELALFGTATSFDRVRRRLGNGDAICRRVIEGVPDSLRHSIEHRYSVILWPC
jgi:hypothetical protein